MATSIKHSGQIFKNPVLEKLTKSSPFTTIAFYVFLIFIFLYLSSQYTTLSFFATAGYYISGLFIWTFIEYILHRFVFHMDEYFPFMKRFCYIVHGVHHENPGDRKRLFMPPVPGTIIAFVLFSFGYLFLNVNAFAFMAGISNGYLFYSYIHYIIHAKPTNRFLLKYRTHHARHHYIYPDKAFGVSNIFWDVLFRTMPPKRKK